MLGATFINLNLKFTIMKALVFIHEDVENLAYFSDTNGISAYNNRIILYAMQLSNIVGIFYTKEQAIEFYERNKFKSDLPIIYKFNQSLWDAKHPKSHSV